ncbi:MAG: DUF58 domain-containing protein [Spirochaetales bacterium]|nr:DUF58 domain-containing protein [Spirochaetales bacterium]
MNDISKLIKKVIPLTGRGLFFFLLSGAILIAGILRADLAALFWGCGFYLLALYSLVGNHLSKSIARRFLKTHLNPATFTLSSNGIFPKTETWAEIKAEMPSFFIPGFTVRANIALHWQDRIPLLISAFLTPGINKETIGFTPVYRGIYKSSTYDFIFQDLLGFTLSTFSLPLEEYIKVYPAVIKRDELMIKIAGEATTDARKIKKTSDELLEIKKYYPGDDVRRLNWKVFAHTGELFIRKGEETPPPDVRLLFILDPTRTPLLSLLPEADYLDSLIEVIGSIMIAACDNGNPVNLAIPGHKRIEVFSSKQKKDLLSLFAGIWWKDEEKNIILPSKKDMHALIFTSPGSTSLPHILGTIKERGWGVSLYFKHCYFPDNGERSFDIKRLLFIRDGDTGNRTGGETAGNIFQKTLTAEIDRYKRTPWRLKYVSEI